MAVDLLTLEIVGHDEASFGYKTLPASTLVELALPGSRCVHSLPR